MGRVHEARGNIDAAEEAYQEAIRIRPEVWLYRSELGIMYANFERHEEAIEQHREVIRLSPENYLGYVDLGTSQMALNRVEEAKAQFQESIRKRPNTLAYRNLGYLNLRTQRFSEAVEALESSNELDGEDWWTWRWLAHAQHWRGQEAEARRAWLRLISLAEPRISVNRNDQDLLCGLAEAHVALGDEQAGRQYLDRLMALSPTTPYNIYWAGRIYEVLGSRDAALELVLRALDSGFDPVAVQQDRWLSDLRQDSRFQEYLAGR
jgi:serine/threonine-protein kinase